MSQIILNQPRRRLPAELRWKLIRHTLSARLVWCGRMAGCLVTAALAWMLLTVLLDRAFAFNSPIRLLLLCMGGILVAAFIARIFFRLFRPIDFHRAAISLEQSSPKFNQRLETIVSQWLQPTEAQTSPEMLDHLYSGVRPELSRCRSFAGVSWLRMIQPWCAAALFAGIAALLLLMPSVGLPQLFNRSIHPLSTIPPVTTTRLTVYPGSTSVIEHTTATVRVLAQRLGEMPPTIHFSSDSLAYAQAIMSPGRGAFTWSMPDAEKTFTYFVTGGDAKTPTYQVTVLHHPAISELRVRYTYPAYTKHRPLAISTTAGPIEAPTGTTVRIGVVATEPLAAASLVMKKESLASTQGDSANIRYFDLLLTHDGTAELKLQAKNGLSSAPPLPITLRAIPDEPPLARLLEPSADMHLTPRDLLTVAWQALDDYGVEKLQLDLQINNSPAKTVDLPLHGDRRRVVGSQDIDLANLPLKIGDMVTASLFAEDAAGHRVRSPLRHILISPRSVDIETYLRLSAMLQSADLSAALADNLQDAVKILDKAGPDSSLASGLYSDLSSAADAARLLQQSLLATIQHRADPQTTAAMTAFADDVAITSTAVDQAQSSIGNSQNDRTPIHQRLRQVLALMQKAHDQLLKIAQGQQAAIVLADRANVRDMAKPHQSDPQLRLRIQQTLARAADEAAAGVTLLGIPANAPDVDNLLIEKIKTGDRAIADTAPVNLIAAARQWSAQMSNPPTATRDLSARLSALAAVETVRVDCEPVWARDLQLAGRAANRIQEMAMTNSIVSKQVLEKIIAEFPSQLDAMSKEHQLRVKNSGAASGDSSILAAAESARAQMKLWAAEPELLTFTADTITRQQARDVAMEANARMALHDYAGAAALDARLAQSPEANQARQNIVAAARAMHTAESVDTVGSRQQAIAQRTRQPKQPALLARDQRHVAQSIESVRQQAGDQTSAPSSRDRAMAAIRRAQEQLAAMPAALNQVQNGNDNIRQLRRSFTTASDTITKLITDLSAFTPETRPAVQAMQHSLVPALQALARAVASGRSTEISSAVAQARNAIADCQQQLQNSQQTFAEQDPLIAAKWFAQAAASALSQQPPDLATARREQTNAAHALQNAWNNAIRRAALNRLEGSATISSLFAPPPAPPNPPNLASTAAHSWDSIDPNPGEPSNESEPAGYAPALRAYFHALSQTSEK